MSQRPRPDLLFSADVETDGPIPGPYSMLSLGICVVGCMAPDGSFERHDLRAATFYRELKPISDRWLPEALAVGGFDREVLAAEGAEPSVAMPEAASWVRDLAAGAGARPVLVGWPIVFDWMFLHWYFTSYCPEGDPFGHSSALDIKTLAWSRLGRPIDMVTPQELPAEVRSEWPHTHNALDDAQQQGDLFARLLTWRP